MECYFTKSSKILWNNIFHQVRKYYGIIFHINIFHIILWNDISHEVRKHYKMIFHIKFEKFYMIFHKKV